MTEKVKREIDGKRWIFLLGYEPQKKACSGDLRKLIKEITVEGVCYLATHLKIAWSDELKPSQIMLSILRSEMVSTFEVGLNDLHIGISKRDFKTIIGIELRPKNTCLFRP